ncbi:MAG TPA: GntR family transcriptional regulator, partial [Rugosimonospora sp.]|nr:GntR family transcriptional regulator [Rugosimonospora sp.]
MITRRPSLREGVAGALRAALVAGELRPGEVYSAPKLARRFGVSATPVREALLHLADEGLLAAVPNKGFRVVEISDRDLDEIAALRQMLEVPAVGELARGSAAPGLDTL